MNQLPAVMPATDWLGVGATAAIVLVIVLLVGYIILIKLKAGKQFGEEQFERLAALIAQKQEVTVSVPAASLTYDGHTFPDQASLDKYKEAKAIVDAIKGDTL